jgi:histone deacetylase complex regulatory component SIN3
MIVSIRASGTDKLKAERQAKEEAQLGLSDPINYMKDTGRTDAEIRAEMAFLFNNAPELYFKRFIKKEEVADIAGGIIAQNQQTQAQVQGGGQAVPPPTVRPSPQNTGNIPQVAQGSPRSLLGRAGAAISGLIRR